MSCIFKKMGNSTSLIILSIALILGGSFFANMFNTSFYSTEVTRIDIETDTGTLSGLLYLPKGVNEENPRPTIITTHGYLNSGEMQDAGAIELSRRGYVVLALDMYDHGHSTTKTEFEAASAFFTFWPTSLYDAAQYMYKQDYVLKDDSGNGIIAVAGHSMGGFSSVMALVMDEQEFATTGVRKIYAGLAMGADYTFTSYLEITGTVAAQAFGPRVVGKIAAHYDEFFFDQEASQTGKSVVYKDYVDTIEGQEFLGNPPNPKEGQVYTLDNGGKRVIYTPNETHPWNHFSAKSTKHQIQFYNMAFEDYKVDNNISSSNQIWLFKELFEFIALIGFFLLLVPLASLLLKIPFFSTAKTKPSSTIEGPSTGLGKVVYWITISFCALFPALFFPALMDKAGTGMTILKIGSLVVIGLSVIIGIVAIIKQKNKNTKGIIIGTIFTSLVALVLFMMVVKATDLFNTNSYFNEPTTNQILYWALVVTAVMAAVALITHYLDKKPKNVLLKQYGFIANWKSILVALLTAIIVVVAGYLVLFIIDAIFKTDFRLWVWAVKTFEVGHVNACLKYIPFFFLYFYTTGITVNANTGFIKGWKGYLIGIIATVGGLVLYLILQYGKLFITGTALWPTQALTSILLFALIPTLTVSVIFAKALYKKTGNVYTGVFLNTILMTMITVANTTLYSGIQ